MHDILILLRIELKRLFKSKLFYVSLFIGLALSVGGFIECAKPHLNITNGFNGGVETYPFSVFNSWMGMFMGLKPISTSYLYIFMLLAALPYCGFFCRDNKNQYILQYYSRMSKNKIHAARFIATFISGGLVTMLPLLLNLCATMMFIPALKPSAYLCIDICITVLYIWRFICTCFTCGFILYRQYIFSNNISIRYLLRTWYYLYFM